jgi:hypothetical protein
VLRRMAANARSGLEEIVARNDLSAATRREVESALAGLR